MNDRDVAILLAFADNNMSATATSRQLFMHVNSVYYHLNRVKHATGLDPKKFYDLVELTSLYKEDANGYA